MIDTRSKRGQDKERDRKASMILDYRATRNTAKRMLPLDHKMVLCYYPPFQQKRGVAGEAAVGKTVVYHQLVLTI